MMLKNLLMNGQKLENKQLYEELYEYYGDKLANFDQQPEQFKFQLKTYLFNKYLKKEYK